MLERLRHAWAFIFVLLLSKCAWGVIDTVKVQDFRFIPASLTIHAGDTVVWKVYQECCLPHTSTRGNLPMSWDSGPLPMGGTFRLAFPDTGTFAYACDNHAYIGMIGSITVQPPPAPPLSTVDALGWLGLGLLGASLAAAGIWSLRRKRKTA